MNPVECARGDTVPTKVGAVLRALARLTAQVCAVDRCSIFVRRDDVLLTAVSEFATGRSDPALWHAFANLEVKMGLQAPAILAEMLRDRRPRLVTDLSHEPGIPDECKQFGAATTLIVPLLRDAEVVGLLVLDTSASVIGASERRRARQLARGLSLVLERPAGRGDTRSRVARDAAQAALDQERMRIDCILHDGARQTVFSMAMKIELALMGGGKTSALRAALRTLKQDAATLMAQMREVVPRTDE